MRGLRPLSLLLALAVLGGCLAAPGPAGETTTTPTDAATQTPTSTEQSTVPPGETPLPGSPTPDESNAGKTIDYADLPAESRAAFDDAFDHRVSFVPDSPYVEGEHTVDAASPFHDYEYVRKNGTRYPIDLSMDGELYASYGIDSERVDGDVNGTVVPVSNVSTEVRDEVRWAVENGTHHVPAGKWDSLPGELGGLEHVCYEGETYSLSYIVGDYWALRLTVEDGN
ncbi:hypothetical protein ACFQMA_04670 [Halosimplex aquaticum]|uniref:DUF7979 domain-containing protein n=1 Tax=Halosimplex aquaticum TaxID=3026162 RepID=A0ABD5XYR6_9EURY|nr:hypothetical protein [Halosimplex aquaticum]